MNQEMRQKDHPHSSFFHQKSRLFLDKVRAIVPWLSSQSWEGTLESMMNEIIHPLLYQLSVG
jgi:hypothetical protein